MHKHIDLDTFKTFLKDGMSIFVGGFLTCGTPEPLIDAVVQSNVKELTIICNDAGMPNKGVGKLIENHQVKKLFATHIGTNPKAGQLMQASLLDIELIPQGTLVEQIRAYGAGLGGVLTPVGLNTLVEKDKQKIKVKEKTYLLYEPIGADIALIEAKTVDALGNLVYDKTARNFNPVMATAAHTVFAYVFHFEETLDPESIITPHVFVDYVLGDF